MASNKMTTCKSCGKEIAKSAKVCPNCGAKNKKPFYKAVWFWVLIVLIFALIGSCSVSDNDGGESKNNEKTSITSTTKPEKATVPTTAPTEAPIVYESVSVNDMMEALEGNALKAKDTYDDKYLEISGKLSIIDSNGAYISVFPTNNDFAIVGVQCFVKNEQQKEDIMNLTVGDNVVIKGKITDVGEVLGYSMDIEEIVK